jgi:hypothetical protein
MKVVVGGMWRERTILGQYVKPVTKESRARKSGILLYKFIKNNIRIPQ